MKKIIAILQILILCVVISAPFSVSATPDNYISSDSEVLVLTTNDIDKQGDYDSVSELSLKLKENDINDELVLLDLKPTDFITRAEAVYVLVAGLGDEVRAVKPADLSVFNDYQDVDPLFKESLSIAVSIGALNGSDNAMLLPNDYISRVEAFSIVSRALSQNDIPQDPDSDGISFSDVPDWAEKDIDRLKNASLIYGYGDGTLGSYDIMTFEQIYTVYKRILNFQNDLPTGGLYKNNYYEYINGQWISETKLPEGYAKWSNIEQLSQSNAYRIQNIINEIITNYYLGYSFNQDSNEQKIFDVYRAAANVKYRDSIGIEPIMPYIKMIDSAKNITELTSVMAELEKNGFKSLLPISVNNDFKDSSKYCLSFESCYTGVVPSMIKSDKHDKFIKLYQDYISSLFISSGQTGNEANQKAADVAKMCTDLGKSTMNDTEWANPDSINNIYNSAQLSSLFYNFNIKSYLNELGYSEFDTFIVYDEKLAQTINSYLTVDNLALIKNYLKASVLDFSSIYLNTETFDIYQRYIDNMSGVSSDLTPDTYAITITQSLLGLELGEEYVERYFSPDSKREIEDLAGQIIKTFKNRLGNITWMSDATKNTAIGKLESISVRIGYPEYLSSYENKHFKVKSIDYGGNLIEYITDYNKNYLSQKNNLINNKISVNKDNWTIYPQKVNAYYDRANNCIVIPAGILQAPYYSPNASFESNLGGIGSIIAHEITHAFDNVGSQFDKDGNLNDWWTAEDFTAFNSICKKFVKEYNKIEMSDGMFVDGSLTLSENIADIGAMACILDVAGADNNNLDELFKSYARTYRSICTDDYAKMLLITDEHSPNIVRTNMVLSNFQAFIDLYNIGPKDKMFIPEENRLSIW